MKMNMFKNVCKLAVIALAFALVFGACSEYLEDNNGQVSIKPVGKAASIKAVDNGVLISIPKDPTVSSRSIEVMTVKGDRITAKTQLFEDKNTMMYLDLYYENNSWIEPNTEYIYTVYQRAGSAPNLNDRIQELKVKTKATFKDEGTQVAAPTDVSLVYNQQNGEAILYFTPASDGVVPCKYYYTIYKDGVFLTDNVTTTAPLYLGSSMSDGKYTVEIGGDTVGTKNGARYYKSSDPVKSEEVEVASLFGGSWGNLVSNAWVDEWFTSSTPKNTLRDFDVVFDLSYIPVVKPGVLYTLQFAEEYEDNTWTDVTLKYDSTPAGLYTWTDVPKLEADLLGKLLTVTDEGRHKGIAVKKAELLYRVKATKGEKVQYENIGSVKIDPLSGFANPSLGNMTKSAAQTYTVTPSVSYKGGMDGAYAIIYWAVYDDVATSVNLFGGEYGFSDANSKKVDSAAFEAETVQTITIPAKADTHVSIYYKFFTADGNPITTKAGYFILVSGGSTQGMVNN